MASPVHIETAFQHLSADLKNPDSFWLPLLALKRLLESGRIPLPLLESYLLDIADHLPTLKTPLSYAGINPQTLAQLARHLERVSEHSFLLQDTRLPGFITELHRAAHEQNTYIGQAEYEPIPAKPKAHRDSLSEAYFPVVECPHVEQAALPCVGQWCRAHLKLAYQKGSEDHIEAQARIWGDQTNGTVRKARTVTLAVRNLIVRHQPELADWFVRGSFTFEANFSRFSGTSWRLAQAMLLFCEMVRQAEVQDHYRIATATAFTGDLDADGQVLAVDEETLPAKIEAAFFSRFKTLAVPASQLDAALDQAGRLHVQYPGKSLELIGVRHLGDVLSDRRLIEHERVDLVRHTAQKAWKRRYSIGGVATILGLLLVIGRLLYGPLDQNPVNAKYVEETLLFENKYGQVIGEMEVGAATVDIVTSSQAYKLFDFYDINGDGVNELFWIQARDPQNDYIDYVHSYDVRRKITLWKYPFQKKLDFPNKPEVSTDVFSARHVHVEDLDQDGTVEVIVSGWHHAYFPYIYQKLNAHTGEELSHFLHVGWLNEAWYHDLTGDGVKEVILGGTSNAFQDAILAVLDPRLLGGVGPTQADYRVADYQPAPIQYYIRFPRTRVGEILKYRSFAPAVRRLRYQNSTLIVEITDFSLYDPRIDEPKTATIFLHLGLDLTLQSLGTHTHHDNMARLLVKAGYPEAELGSDYLETYKQQIQYWNGDAWVSGQPVMNQRYLEALAAWEDAHR